MAYKTPVRVIIRNANLGTYTKMHTGRGLFSNFTLLFSLFLFYYPFFPVSLRALTRLLNNWSTSTLCFCCLLRHLHTIRHIWHPRNHIAPTYSFLLKEYECNFQMLPRVHFLLKIRDALDVLEGSYFAFKEKKFSKI